MQDESVTVICPQCRSDRFNIEKTGKDVRRITCARCGFEASGADLEFLVNKTVVRELFRTRIQKAFSFLKRLK